MANTSAKSGSSATSSSLTDGGQTPDDRDKTPNTADVDATNADVPGNDSSEPDWEKWEAEHPDESWIVYLDENRNPVRVPVWRYRELGL